MTLCALLLGQKDLPKFVSLVDVKAAPAGIMVSTDVLGDMYPY